jgi:hypothetical protein
MFNHDIINDLVDSAGKMVKKLGDEQSESGKEESADRG